MISELQSLKSSWVSHQTIIMPFPDYRDLSQTKDILPEDYCNPAAEDLRNHNGNKSEKHVAAITPSTTLEGLMHGYVSGRQYGNPLLEQRCSICTYEESSKISRHNNFRPHALSGPD